MRTGEADSARRPNAPAAARAAPHETHFVCPRCGYDLHGLPGDPVRCPECGCSTPLAELLAAADPEFRAAMRQARAANVAAAAVLVLTGFFAVRSLRDPMSSLVITGAGLAIWHAAMSLLVRRYISHRPGWYRRSVFYQAQIIGVFALGAVIVGSGPVASLYLRFGNLVFGGAPRLRSLVDDGLAYWSGMLWAH